MANPVVRELKLMTAHLIVTPNSELTPQIQLFFQDSDKMMHAIAMPVTVFNNPPANLKKE